MTIEAQTPPLETLVITAVMLSNGVPVNGGKLRAKLWPPGGREPSPFRVRWQTVEAADPASDRQWACTLLNRALRQPGPALSRVGKRDRFQAQEGEQLERPFRDTLETM